MMAVELASVPTGSGLYRIRGHDFGLVYVGEGDVRSRLRTHARKIGHKTEQGRVMRAAAPLEFSMVIDGRWLAHERRELENDLIAAHVLAVGQPPAAQFIG
jgi:hypothetical protein